MITKKKFCIHFIRIYHLLWSSTCMRNKLLTNHRHDIKTHGEGRWTQQGWIIPYLMSPDIYSLSHSLYHMTWVWENLLIPRLGHQVVAWSEVSQCSNCHLPCESRKSFSIDVLPDPGGPRSITFCPEAHANSTNIRVRIWKYIISLQIIRILC